MTVLEELEQKLRKRNRQMELRRDEPLSRHTSFRIGGPAALMALPKTRDEAMDAVHYANKLGVRPFFLGNGSNLLVSDGGYDGFVIKTTGLERLEWVDFFYEGRKLVVGSGVLLSRLAHFAAEEGLAGLEFAAGIPGTVGGAVVMNAGAYGGEICQVLDKVNFLTDSGDVLMLDAKACEFSYRRSIFSRIPEWMVLDVSLRPLEKEDPAKIKARMDELAERRKSKQPLDLPSAGSTFKRPAPILGPDGAPQPVYAAALIEQCGCKGLRVGGAQVSEKHAGFVVNTGGATCADVLSLIAEVKRRVREQTGIELEAEVKTLGI